MKPQEAQKKEIKSSDNAEISLFDLKRIFVAILAGTGAYYLQNQRGAPIPGSRSQPPPENAAGNDDFNPDFSDLKENAPSNLKDDLEFFKGDLDKFGIPNKLNQIFSRQDFGSNSGAMTMPYRLTINNTPINNKIQGSEVMEKIREYFKISDSNRVSSPNSQSVFTNPTSALLYLLNLRMYPEMNQGVISQDPSHTSVRVFWDHGSIRMALEFRLRFLTEDRLDGLNIYSFGA